MFMFKVLSCILVLYYYEIVFAAAQRKCFDCVSIHSCAPALNILRNIPNISRADNNTFFTSICGFYKGAPKVCCSDFNNVDTATVELHANIEKPNLTVPTTSEAVRPPIMSVDLRFTPKDNDKHQNAWLLPETCGEIDGTRIVGGEVAKLYEFPWIALIAYNTAQGLKFRCAGSIINSRYILTAAHCVISRRFNETIAYVRIGEWDVSTDMDCQGDYLNMICESKLQDIPVKEKIVHKNFSAKQSKAGRNDIALLRLTYDIVLTNNNAQPICLPLYWNLQNVNLGTKTAVVAGWGATESSPASSVLMKVEIPILSSEVCRSHHGGDYTDLMPTSFCAGKTNKDSCRGDSGGPLMIEAEYDGTFRLVQYGIVSSGPTKCGSGTPGFYTDVTKYMGWILDNIKS